MITWFKNDLLQTQMCGNRDTIYGEKDTLFKNPKVGRTTNTGLNGYFSSLMNLYSFENLSLKVKLWADEFRRWKSFKDDKTVFCVCLHRAPLPVLSVGWVGAALQTMQRRLLPAEARIDLHSLQLSPHRWDTQTCFNWKDKLWHHSEESEQNEAWSGMSMMAVFT